MKPGGIPEGTPGAEGRERGGPAAREDPRERFPPVPGK